MVETDRKRYSYLLYTFSPLQESFTHTVPTPIVDAATILGFQLFGESTIQTKSTIQ